MNPYGAGYMSTGENALGRSLYERGVTPQTDTLGGTEYGRGGQNAVIPYNGNGCRQIVLAPYAKFLYGRPCDGAIGSRCYLTCEPGFDLIGSCFRVCGTDRRWSGSEMLCVRPAITCPAPNFHTNIKIIAGCQNMAGFSCTLGCRSGGVPMIGGAPLRNGMIFCQVEGRWSQDPSLISCGAGGTLGGEGIGVGTERGTYGDERRPYDSERRGRDGVNSGTLDTETSRGRGGVDGQVNPATGGGINGRPSGALNGFVEGEGRSISAGKSIEPTSSTSNTDEYHHDRFFAGDDRKMRLRLPKCTEDEQDDDEYQENQTWSSERRKNRLFFVRQKRATKQITCAPLNPPKHGQSSGQCAPGLPGRICRFNCILNYTMRGQSSITCGLAGEWSSSPARCIHLSQGES